MKAKTKTRKVYCVVKFSKGITASKDYQSVRYDIGIEMPFELGSNGSGFYMALAKLEKMVNRELLRRKQQAELDRVGR